MPDMHESRSARRHSPRVRTARSVPEPNHVGDTLAQSGSRHRDTVPSVGGSLPFVTQVAPDVERPGGGRTASRPSVPSACGTSRELRTLEPHRVDDVRARRQLRAVRLVRTPEVRRAARGRARLRGAPRTHSAPHPRPRAFAGTVDHRGPTRATDACYGWDEYGIARRRPLRRPARGPRRSLSTSSDRAASLRVRTSATCGSGATGVPVSGAARRAGAPPGAATANSTSQRRRIRRRSATLRRGASPEAPGGCSRPAWPFPGRAGDPTTCAHLSGGLEWALAVRGVHVRARWSPRRTEDNREGSVQ